jgi:hypothetical protein
MKKNYLFAFFILLSSFSFSQTPNQDTIYTLKGEFIPAFVVNISEYDITYSFPGEQLTYTIAKATVKHIQFGSGRIQYINNKVNINSEEDWEFVRTTQVPSDIKGLNLKEDISASSYTYGYGNANEEKVMERLKRKAASIGAHIILVESKILDKTKYTISGKAYGY